MVTFCTEIILRMILHEHFLRNLPTWSLPKTERLWNPFNLRISVSGSHILSTNASSTGIHSSVSDEAAVWFTIFSCVCMNNNNNNNTLRHCSSTYHMAIKLHYTRFILSSILLHCEGIWMILDFKWSTVVFDRTFK